MSVFKLVKRSGSPPADGIRHKSISPVALCPRDKKIQRPSCDHTGKCRCSSAGPAASKVRMLAPFPSARYTGSPVPGVIDQMLAIRRPGNLRRIVSQEVVRSPSNQRDSCILRCGFCVPAIQISDPSPENPISRKGPCTSPALPLVRFCGFPLADWLSHTSKAPSWSETKATNFPSGEMAGLLPLPRNR